MIRALLGILLAWPVFADSQVVTTERVDLARNGVIHVTGSTGGLTVEGWDRPEVEITVIKSVPNASDSRRLERVHVTTQRGSGAELTISTAVAARGVTLDYEIHAPRTASLVIHHGQGAVLVKDMAGDLEVNCRRGDIVLMLRESGHYSIDAKSKFGPVVSDFEGETAARRYLLGQRYTAVSPASGKIRLRVGWGGIAIKSIPPD